MERERPDEFTPMPVPHYWQVSMMLFEAAQEDFVTGVEEPMRLIQAIKEIRQQKILSGLSSLDGTPLFVLI